MIVVAGESLIDVVEGADGARRSTPGGGPYNVARALGRLGVAVAFLGRISGDPSGRQLATGLADDGVSLELVTTTSDPTLVAHADLDAAGRATYRFEPPGSAAAGLVASDLPDGLPADTTALHVGTLGLVLEPTATTIAALVGSVATDILVVLDLNIRPAAIHDEPAYRRRLEAVLGRIDVIKASTDDLAWLDPDLDALSAARRLLERGLAVVLVTDGPAPIRIVTAADVVQVPVPAVEVVDTIGAGDAFGAGFLAAWTRAGRRRSDLGDPDALLSAVRVAIEVGARTVTRAGADPPTLAELDAVRGHVPGW